MKNNMHRTKQCWSDMHQRCRNPANKFYKDYGSRGINVCSAWYSFDKFLSDMGVKPQGYSLDRVDNDSGYCKENCRWATSTQNSCNRRVTAFVELGGIKIAIAELARIHNLPPDTLYRRIKRGWSAEKAVAEPIRISAKGLKPGRQASFTVRYKGNKTTVKALAAQVGIKYSTLWGRLRHGWSVEAATATPVNNGEA